MAKKTKRTIHFVMKPQYFDIVCPKCNGSKLDWSEWNSHIWCYDCKKDYKNYVSPMDGPVPIDTALLLGINMDRWDMVNKVIIEMKDSYKTPSPPTT